MNKKQKATHTEKVCREILKHQRFYNEKLSIQFNVISDLKSQIARAEDLVSHYQEEYDHKRLEVCKNENISISFIDRIISGRAKKEPVEIDAEGKTAKEIINEFLLEENGKSI